METVLAEFVVNTVATFPWLIWVYAAGLLGATFIRGGWPEEEQRPAWMKGLLALFDICQLNLSGPVRTAMSKKPQ